MKYDFKNEIMKEINKKIERLMSLAKDKIYDASFLSRVVSLLEMINKSHFPEFDKLKLVTDGVFLLKNKIILIAKNAYNNIIAMVINNDGLTLYDEEGSIYLQILIKDYVASHDIKMSFIEGNDVLCISKIYKNGECSFNLDIYNNAASEGINKDGKPVDKELIPDNEVSSKINPYRSSLTSFSTFSGYSIDFKENSLDKWRIYGIKLCEEKNAEIGEILKRNK